MLISNTTLSPLVLAGVLIGAGERAEVPSDHPQVREALDGLLIVPIPDEPAATSGDADTTTRKPRS